MHKSRFGKSSALCLLLALSFLPGCATLENKLWRERVEKCYQPRDAELADWPERLEDFPVAGLQWLAVIREERRLERIERDCISDL